MGFRFVCLVCTLFSTAADLVTGLANGKASLTYSYDDVAVFAGCGALRADYGLGRSRGACARESFKFLMYFKSHEFF